MTTEIERTIEQIENEIRVDIHGKGSASIRGVARLCGVDESTLRAHFESAGKKPSKLAKTLISHGFKPAGFSSDGVPDVAVGLIISHFAGKAGKRCTEQSRIFNDVFIAIGVRTWMQKITGWQHPYSRRLTEDEICELCLLPTGREWKRRFGKEFYEQLSRLTGLEQQGHHRPALWGRLTDEFVYQPLPSGVRNGVRQCRENSDGWEKLHQFLSDEGLAIFEKHMETLYLLMRSSETINDLRRAFETYTKNHYQFRLFEDCRKDGTLTISKRL
ncbi:MAG: P63C domain-containing protein [Cyanobacteria bacterium P01_A01_bin.37]